MRNSAMDMLKQINSKGARGKKVTVRKATKEELAAFGTAQNFRKAPLFEYGPLILTERDDSIGCPRMITPYIPIDCVNAKYAGHICGQNCEKRVRRGRGDPRQCGRTDYHSCDEAFGGASGIWNTMSSAGRPRKTVACGHTVHIHGCKTCANSSMKECLDCTQIREEERNA